MYIGPTFVYRRVKFGLKFLTVWENVRKRHGDFIDSHYIL